MNTINRLQFRHHSDVFTAPTLDKARSAAKKYIYEDIWRNEVLEGDEPHYGRSLLAEPTILRYAIDGEEPHIMFCIGADTNEDGWTNDYNKFCIIDIDKTEAEIEDLGQALEDAIKSLTVTALSSTTLNMFAEKTDDSTFISGEVKVAESTIFPEEGIVRKNDLRIVTNPTGDKKYEGLFIYIDLNYDEEKEEFTFKVNDESGTTVPLLNHYVTGGTYHIEDQSIWLDIKDIDEPVKIDCTNLIDEWTVDEGTKTPVILTKTEVKMDSPDYVHHKPNQDILSADIRIKDETINPITKQYEKLATSSNILNRTSDGRCLYVDGKASNIIYYKDGEKTSVKSVLDELTKLKLSNDSNNIIVNKVDGFFASSKLEYISNENKLIFKVSSLNDNGQIVDKKTEIELNTVEVFKYIYYDTVTEELVLTYTDDKGEEKIVRIPIGKMIDEWDVFNEGHNINLYKNRDVAGKDKLSADAKIATTAAHNILEDRNHELYVRGEADNIKYDVTGATTVKNVLDTLSGKIDTEIARSESADTKHDNEIAELSANTQASLKTISADSSINVEIGDIAYPQVGKKADIKVNLSSQSGNTIRLLEDGLFNFIDLKTENYSGGTKIILYYSDSTQSTGVNTREAVVDNISFIDSITYDPSDETLVIVYYSGTTRKEERIPLRGLINEWKPADDNDNQAIKLRRVSAATGSDILYASATTSPKDDNILVIDYENNALYVSNSGITKNAYDINHEIQRATSVENEIRDVLNAEIERSEQKDHEHDNDISDIKSTIGSGFSSNAFETVTYQFGVLNDKLIQEGIDRASEDNALRNLINEEIDYRVSADTEERNRAISAETILTDKIGTGFTTADTNNVTAKFNALSGALNTEIQDRINDVNAEETRATGVENQLRTDLIAETTRATSAETTLHNEIVTETNRAISAETTLNTKLDNEISHSVAKDNEHDTKISANETAISNEVTRATNAENDLDDKITAEKNRAQSAETALNTAIDTERTRATNAESTLTSNLNAEITRSSNRDDQLQADLTAEVTRSTNFDNALSGALETEITNRTTADTALRTAIDNEVTRATNAETTLQTALNTEISERKADAVHYADYNPSGKTIDFKNKNGVIIDSIDATNFIKDGMVNSVYLDNTNRQLVIVFNTDAGQETIKIELNQIFDPSNYYTKSEVNAISGNLQTAISNEVTRATSAETELQTAITNEISRATGVENTIKNSTFTITQGLNTVTFHPGTSTAITITGVTKISDLDNDLEKLTWSLGTPIADSTGYNGSSAKGITIPSSLSHLDGVGTLTLKDQTGGTTTFNPKDGNATFSLPTTIKAFTNDLSSLTWALGAPSADGAGYNGSTGKSFNIPSNLSHLSGVQTLTIQKNGTNVGTYNPTGVSTINITVPTSTSELTNDLAALTVQTGVPSTSDTTYNGSTATTLRIANQLQHLTNWDAATTTLNVPGSLNVAGQITATSAIYSSDVNLKENINNADINKKIAARKVEIKEFNFKDNPNKDKVYGIIAQEVEEQGLNEIVFTKEDGYKAVDYTSLMMLKIGYLENENEALKNTIMDLKARLENLENKQ